MDFGDIAYLRNGTARQHEAYKTLVEHQVLEKLHGFDPVLVGTIPICVDIPSSDLDIICFCKDRLVFRDTLIAQFGSRNGFRLTELTAIDPPAVVATFTTERFTIEIFGQGIPTRLQNAYRHMIVEFALLNRYGETFRQDIIALKLQGYKTEPAFAQLLGLTGDPYEELLRLEPLV